MFEKCDSSNRQKGMVASFSISKGFTAKFQLVFDLTQENGFSLRSYFKANKTIIGSCKNGSRDFYKS